MHDLVTVDVSGGVQTIRFERAEMSNALTADMCESATDALSLAERDTSIRAVLIAGMPGVFTAGHDTTDLRNFIADASFGQSPVRFFKTLTTLDKPILAAVDGLAFGIGTVLLFHCDYVVASEWSIFSAPFAEIGLPPEGAISVLAPRLMGYHRAFELLVMGEQFDARRALAAGLVNQVVPPEEVEDAAHKAAERLAAKPPEAVRMARRMLRGERREVLQRIDQEASGFTDLLRSPHARDALTGYIQGRG